jgi:hypothetical protein
MIQQMNPSTWHDWQKPGYFAAAWLVFWFFLMVSGGMDAIFFIGFFAFLPMLCIGLVLIGLLIIAAVNRPDRRHALQILVWLVIVWGIPLSLYRYEWAHPLAVSEKVRWLAQSGKYKRDFQRESTSANTELRHADWDVEGPAFATIYTFLIFDPSNSLASAALSHRPGKYPGLPCEVHEVRRLESGWYVTISGTPWNDCN